jgi:hypothetical protein
MQSPTEPASPAEPVVNPADTEPTPIGNYYARQYGDDSDELIAPTSSDPLRPGSGSGGSFGSPTGIQTPPSTSGSNSQQRWPPSSPVGGSDESGSSGTKVDSAKENSSSQEDGYRYDRREVCILLNLLAWPRILS